MAVPFLQRVCPVLAACTALQVHLACCPQLCKQRVVWDYALCCSTTGSNLALCPLLQHNMPFWRITNHADLVSLHQALELDFL